MKGEGIVFAKKGKSFDPVQIPKAIQDAGFTSTEVSVVALGSVEQTNGGLRLKVPGLNRPFLLAGGAKLDALAKRKDIAGKNFQITGRLQNEKQVPALTVDDFQEPPVDQKNP